MAGGWRAAAKNSWADGNILIIFYYLLPEINCVRRLPAILFLLILLFNLIGYRWVIAGLQNSSDIALESQVDELAYNENDLISVKTTLHLPYYSNSSTYERVYGAININGTEYAYVKRRVVNDTLELLCLPNKTKTHLQATAAEWAHSAADGATSLPFKKSNSTLKINPQDIFHSVTGLAVETFIATGKSYALTLAAELPKAYPSLPERPPRGLSFIIG